MLKTTHTHIHTHVHSHTTHTHTFSQSSEGQTQAASILSWVQGVWSSSFPPCAGDQQSLTVLGQISTFCLYHHDCLPGHLCPSFFLFVRTPDIGTGPTLSHDDVTLNVTTAAKAAFSNEVIVAGKTWAGTQTSIHLCRARFCPPQPFKSICLCPWASCIHTISRKSSPRDLAGF